MKQKLLPVLLCAAALSCTGERVVTPDDGESRRINFSTRLEGEPITRGAVLSDPAGLAARGGFDVWALSHPALWNTNPAKTALLDNVKVTGADSGSGLVWSSAATAEWPHDRYVSFFAYGPAGSATVGTPSSAGSPTLSFEVNGSVAAQTDLVVAKPIFDQTGAGYSGSKPVPLIFGHALCRIVISGVLLNGTGRSVSVKSVTLGGLYHTGSIDLGARTLAWNVDDTSTTSYTLTAGSELADVPLSATAANLTTATGYMFLVPQTLERAAGLDPTMQVTLTEQGAETVYPSLVFSPAEWLPGKSYNYQLVVDGDQVRLVLVSVDDLALTDWNVKVMIQPVPLAGNTQNDQNRLYSALSALGHLNLNEDNNVPPPTACNYFAIYLMNDMRSNLVVSMNGYERMFTEGENVIFDGRKIVGAWTPGVTFTLQYDPTYWTLEPALQNVTDPVDASTGATATASSTPALSATISTYGSVIVKRNATPAP